MTETTPFTPRTQADVEALARAVDMAVEADKIVCDWRRVDDRDWWPESEKVHCLLPTKTILRGEVRCRLPNGKFVWQQAVVNGTLNDQALAIAEAEQVLRAVAPDYLEMFRKPEE